MVVTLPKPILDVSKIAKGDRSLSGHRVIELRGDRFEDAAICKLRRPRLDRIVDSQLAFLNENHCRNCGDGFPDRSDAGERVALHQRGLAERHRAQRLHKNMRSS
jgi:hypothetical protein